VNSPGFEVLVVFTPDGQTILFARRFTRPDESHLHVTGRVDALARYTVDRLVW
jgi:hypothetical protein